MFRFRRAKTRAAIWSTILLLCGNEAIGNRSKDRFGVKNTTYRPNLYIIKSYKYLQVAYTLDEKGNASAFPRHYYGPVGLLHEEFGNNKGDARVPLYFPFFSLVPTDDYIRRWSTGPLKILSAEGDF